MRDSILVVDDDVAFRERLVRALEHRGYQAEAASDASSARSKLGSEGQLFDAAVIDLRMPGESGLELVRWMADHQSGTRVLILTGYGSIATAVEAIRLGASDYLTKPADADQILQALFPNDQEMDSTADEPGIQVPSLDRVEWEHLQRVLADSGGNISAAARVLGIERRTLQRKLQKFPPAQ